MAVLLSASRRPAAALGCCALTLLLSTWAVVRAQDACAQGAAGGEAELCTAKAHAQIRARPEPGLEPGRDHSLLQLARHVGQVKAHSHSRSQSLSGVAHLENGTADAAPAGEPGAISSASLDWGGDSPGRKSAGLWCEVGLPPAHWSLKSCPVQGQGGSTTLKVLTYNLFWWNLFGQRGGNGESAGRKIAATSGPEQYDLMGFQECDDMHRILGNAHNQGLSGDYGLLNGGRALAIAWRRSRFTMLAHGSTDVGEDHHTQYYGKRAAQWARLQHRDGKTIFFLNHHGPLPVSHGGGCTGSATAYNILRLIARNAQASDVIIVVGDFNAQPHSSRIQALDGYLNRVFTGSSMGGVDHILSNCAASSTANLGPGGSDHDALSAIFRI